MSHDPRSLTPGQTEGCLVGPYPSDDGTFSPPRTTGPFVNNSWKTSVTRSTTSISPSWWRTESLRLVETRFSTLRLPLPFRPSICKCPCLSRTAPTPLDSPLCRSSPDESKPNIRPRSRGSKPLVARPGEPSSIQRVHRCFRPPKVDDYVPTQSNQWRTGFDLTTPG